MESTLNVKKNIHSIITMKNKKIELFKTMLNNFIEYM